MFFFASCCRSFSTGDGYEVRYPSFNSKRQISFAHSLQEIDNKILSEQKNQIIRIKRSQYEQLIDSLQETNKMWLDQQFLPQKQSIGDPKLIAKWKRLSQIIQNPCIFSGKLSPASVLADYREQIFIQNYFYCTIVALSQHTEIIKNLFSGVQYSKNGLYKVPLRIDGQIEEIIIDDFIPVSSNGTPIFSSSISNQIWLYLLEKVWAKVNEGYININTPAKQIMKAFTWAPCDQFYIKHSEDQVKKIWEKLLNALSKNFICLSQTSQDESAQIDISEAGLLKGQLYSLLEAFNIQDKKGRLNQILKIRSFISIDKLKIRITEQNSLWDLIAEKYKGKNSHMDVFTKQNIFFVRYQDFCKYFSKISVSYYVPQNNYISQIIMANLARGFLYTFEVQKEGRYNIELHQTKFLEKYLEEQNQNSYKRTTIILIHQINGELSFVDGILTNSQKDTLLSVELSPAKYLLYCKFDFLIEPPLSTKYSISINSKDFVEIKKIQRNAYPNILQRAFLKYGRQNPRNKYNNDLMWISYRLFYKQGGFAFIAVGNKKQSTKKFLITFDQKEFVQMNFKLKKPFKNIDQIQTLQVLPGQEKIILARCMNNPNIKSLKFPPQLGIKIQPLDSN